jgi:hypothetical protein
MSDRRTPDSPQGPKHKSDDPASKTGSDPLELIEQCLALFPESDPRQRLLYKLRHAVMLSEAANQQREVEFKKVSDVVAKLTAPANRIGMLLDVPGDGLAHIVVGGAEYYANIDPRVAGGDLKLGTQILVNEAYAVIRTLGYDRNGPILKLTEAMADGRLRFEQEMGRQSLILRRSSDLVGLELKPGDEIRIDPTHRIALEKLADRQASKHVLDEVPKVTWEQIGGQKEAIAAIRKAIEYPLLHASTFEKFKFFQPKGAARLRQNADRPGGGRKPVETGQRIESAKRSTERPARADHRRRVSPCKRAGDSEHVARRVRTDGARSFRAGEGQTPGRRPPVHLHRRSRIHSRHQARHALVQHFKHAGADVLQRNGRHRIAAGRRHYPGVKPA